MKIIWLVSIALAYGSITFGMKQDKDGQQVSRPHGIFMPRMPKKIIPGYAILPNEAQLAQLLEENKLGDFARTTDLVLSLAGKGFGHSALRIMIDAAIIRWALGKRELKKLDAQHWLVKKEMSPVALALYDQRREVAKLLMATYASQTQ